MRLALRPIAYVAPAILLIAFVLYLPSLFGIYYSQFDLRYVAPGRYVGFNNYLRLAGDPEFMAMVVRSLAFTAAAVSLTVALALALAGWVNTLKGWFGMAIQLLVILPWIVSHVVSALLFKWVFVNDIGAGLWLLSQIGISVAPLTSATSAMAILIAYACWRTLGFAVVLLLAGMKSIPEDLYEAASIDGATAWQRFRAITLPLLKTPMLIVCVILTLSNLNNVETPLVITGGGPAGATNIVPLDIFTRAFARFDFSTAIALAIGAFLANMALVISYVRLVKWRV